MARDKQSNRQRGPKPHSHSGPFSRDQRRRGGGGQQSGRRGPQTCPMCGAVVGDLKFHIHAKHDDAISHPRN